MKKSSLKKIMITSISAVVALGVITALVIILPLGKGDKGMTDIEDVNPAIGP